MRAFIVFLFFTQLVIAQNINGIILDSKNNKPIENVTVYFKKGKTGTVSDVKGVFNIHITSKITETDSLLFSRIGYHTQSIPLKTFKKRKTTVYLSKKLESLDQVVVNSSKELKRTIDFKTLASLKTGMYAFGSQIIGNYIYVISGNSSHLEDSGKRALVVINDLPSPSFGDLLKELQNGFYYHGYSDKLQIYDIENNTWVLDETSFRKRAFHNLNSYNNTLYSLGGKRLSPSRKFEYLDDKIEVFDMASKEIIIDHTNPHQAINFASFTYEDNIIVMGGSTALKSDGEKVYTDASHIYNITSGLWYELVKMTSPKETQGVIIDNQIYLIGGHSKSKLKTIESYNITTGTWTNEGDLFDVMAQPGITSHEHIIYIFNDEKLLTYDTIAKTLEEYDINLKLKNSKLHYYKNKLYIIGGYLESSHTIAATANVYVIKLDEFDKTMISKSKKIN